MSQLVDGTKLRDTVVLVDTNVIIEAVRTGTWNAVTGAARIVTVLECHDEAKRGDVENPYYVPVTDAHLARLDAVHQVTGAQRAEFFLADPLAASLDAGERDLFAYAYSLRQIGVSAWVLCSADKAAIAAAVRVNVADALHSLERVCHASGARPTAALRVQHTQAFLVTHRTQLLLGQIGNASGA